MELLVLATRRKDLVSLLAVSQLENYSFLPVMVGEARTDPAKREREGESNPSRECLLDHAAPGAPVALIPAILPQLAQKQRDPGTPFAGTRATLSMTSLEYFCKLRHYPRLERGIPWIYQFKMVRSKVFDPCKSV